MRILAIDPGSTVCAWARSDDGAVAYTGVSRPPTRMSWLERMERIVEDLTADVRWTTSADGRLVPDVDVVAIEETLAYGASVRNASELARGYLIRAITHDAFPGVQLVEVNLATIRRALGLAGNARRELRQDAARARFPGLSQDEADAAAVGLGAVRMAKERADQGA